MKYLLIILTCLVSFSSGAQQKGKRSFFELRIYHYQTAEQENNLHEFFRSAYIPALHKLKKPSIGVFTALKNDTAAVKDIYVLIPHSSLESVVETEQKVSKDAAFIEAGKEYLNGSNTKRPYQRYETILLHAFELAPALMLPDLKGDRAARVYELRNYESATEKLYRNKVEMFNKGGEVALFKDLGFNAIFYGEVIAGATMPNLMYMTSFENMESRNEHWKTFGASPVWKKISSDPYYKDNMTGLQIFHLRPTAYSDY
jgi:hypothetical protein